jgi:type IV secretion system protein VirD4
VVDKQERLERLLLLLALSGCFTLTSQALTQMVAQKLNHSAELGGHFVGGFYPPFAWWDWQEKFYPQAPDAFNLAFIVMGLVALGCFGVIRWMMYQPKPKDYEGLHGTAHWASEEEICQTGLLPLIGEKGGGAYVGAWRHPKQGLYYLRHNGPEHIAAIAPTRSGKGVGLVVPTLLSWTDSVVVNDMKGELWELTAGWRQQEAGNIVLKFDPAAIEGSCCFNPLDEIRLNKSHEVGDVQNLVTILVDPDGKGLEDHWAKTAHAFLTGVILHLLYTHQKTQSNLPRPCLADIGRALSDPDKPIDELYQAMLSNHHWEGGQRHEVVASAARDMLNRAEKERSSVLSTAMSFLSLYRDPLIEKNTKTSDFSISNLMNHEKPVSLYLVVRPADKDRMKPLMRLIINQIVRVLVGKDLTFNQGRPIFPYKHQLLLMLDEFPSLGRLDIFQEALAYIAGYGIKAYLIMQDISQLYDAYGKHESILSNCHIRVAYAPNKMETAEWLSDMVGTQTVLYQEESRSRKAGQLFPSTTLSTRVGKVARPLLTPDECLRLKGPVKGPSGEIEEPGDMLIFVAGHPPIYGTQILYFQDAWFSQNAGLRVTPSGRITSTRQDTSSQTVEPTTV